MAIQNIIYEDKEALQNDTDVPNKNKVTAEDMNEIKKVVNNNGNEIDVFEQTVKQVQEENREEINNIYKDVQASKIHYETEQAKSLYIDDATDSRGKIKVEGNVEQETREGYNLIDILNLELKGQDKGITVKISPDGYLSANGTVKDSSASYTVFITTNVDNLLTDKETYTLWQEVYGKDQNDGIMLQIIANPKTDVEKKYINSATSKKTFVVDKINYSYVLTIQLGVVDSPTVFNNYKNRYMLYKGTDDKEFELYGASPSINYPSKVQCLGSNKNLVTEVLNNLWYNEDTNKFITMQNTVSVIAEIPQNTNITIKKKNGGNRFAVVTSNIKPTTGVDNSVIFIDNENSNRKTYTFKNTDKKWVWVGVQNGGTEEDKQKAIEEIKIEEGETATSYSPYGQGSTEIKHVNENLINEIYQKDTQASSANGIAFQKNKNTVTLTGTATAETNFTILNYQNAPFPFETGQYNISGGKGNDVYFRVFRISDNSNLLLDKGQGANGELKKGEKYLFWLTVNKGAVCNNLELNLQLAKGSIVKPFVENNEQNYILDIQQPMLKWDYFDLDRKKEVHVTNKIILDGTKKFVVGNPAGRYYLDTELNNLSYEAISNCFKQGTENTFNVDNTIVLQTNRINLMNKEIATAEEFDNAVLELYNAGTPIEIYYPTTEPTELDLTESQIQTLEQLNKLRLYKGVNNIFTTEDIALLQAEYEVDLQTLKGIPGPKRRQRRYRCERRYRSNWSKRR